MRPRRLKNEINVVPYIDVMLVLLVIFMVTAPMMTSSVDVPSVGKSSQAPGEALQIVISADESLSLIFPGQPRPRNIPREELMRTVLDARRQNPGQPVLIAGDKSVKYEAVLKVMDELQRQQVERIGLLVQPLAVKTGKK
ncbi:MAG: protein TolR [Candidatus Accumulibacter sp.]|jgi:biopolymer transport protein TolR|nr:protein TolR [Accumulibacter sp.]